MAVTSVCTSQFVQAGTSTNFQRPNADTSNKDTEVAID